VSGTPLSRLSSRVPIRLKLALVSAGLTFAILLLFALVVGAFTTQKLHSSFDDDLRATAADLQAQIPLRYGQDGTPTLEVPSDVLRSAAAGDAAIRVVDQNGRVLGSTPDAPNLGPPSGGVDDFGGYRVVSRPLFTGTLRRPGAFGELEPPIAGQEVAFVQYGKQLGTLDATIGRVQLFLAFGVVGGTVLALLAGLAVARRAMRPIVRLTAAAREVARTRDPAVSLPKPEADDEVADLARTLEAMLGQLDAARGESEATLMRQREFVADASHELRTPLTSILANLELLQDDLAGEEREIAGSALRSSHRMRRLVADLLLLARADAGRRTPRVAVDLAGVAREGAAEASSLNEGRSLELDLPDGDDPSFVEGAPDDLHRLAVNLVENALVHTPAGSSVRVAVRAPANGQVKLEVSDDGPGVPAELRERVFERFARGSGDGAPVTGGSGLGLAIVRAVAEAHGGEVTLEDSESGGALFRVCLPSAGEPADRDRVRPLLRPAAPSDGA